MDSQGHGHQNNRYLVITQLFLPTKGGSAVWFAEVYRRLRGKAIHILTEDTVDAHAYDQVSPNSIHRIGLKRHWWLRPESLAMYAKLLFKAIAVMSRCRIDSVHAGRVLPEGLVGWLVARLFRKPLVIYAHGEEITTWRQWAKFRIMAFTYRHAQMVIANSAFTREELNKLGVAAKKITLISPGVDIERFRPGLEVADLWDQLEIPGEAFGEQKLVLGVGRLSRRKGFDQVIKTLPALVAKGMNVHFALIGIGEDQEYLLKLARQHGVAPRVHLLGHVSPKELPRWYNLADMFVMPNREIDGDTEGFGMVFLEAAACGKPAIAGEAGGTGDAVVDGITGFRVDGRDPDRVMAAMEMLLGDPSLARKMGQAARKRVEEHYSWESVAEKTANCCEQLVMQALSERRSRKSIQE